MGESGLKIEKNFNYKILGFVDTKSLVTKVKNIPEEEWKKFDHRKNFLGQEHVNTLPIQFSEDKNNPVFSYNYKNDFLLNYFNEELKSCYEIIEKHYEGQPYRVMITELIANKNIVPHVDRGYHLTNTHRIHLCIKTNDKVDFVVENEKIELKDGTLFEINNQKTHAVYNHSDENRQHLVIDWGVKNDSYYQ